MNEIRVSETKLKTLNSRNKVYFVYPSYDDPYWAQDDFYPDLDMIRRVKVYTTSDFADIVKFGKVFDQFKPIAEIYIDTLYFKVTRLKGVLRQEWSGALNVQSYTHFKHLYQPDPDTVCHIHAFSPLQYNLNSLNKLISTSNK